MDKEAASRATTVYLVDKRIDMVPELLSSNLCSLRSNFERFAFSCIWELYLELDIINQISQKCDWIKGKTNLRNGTTINRRSQQRRRHHIVSKTIELFG